MGKRGGTEWITPAEFQELAKQSRSPAAVRGCALRKEFIADEIKAGEGESRSVRFRITTGGADRDRDTIAPAGWQLDNYRKNPVVLFGHDYSSLPVAKTTLIESSADGLSSVAEFVPADVYPFAETVHQMVKGGFLNAASVGFRPVAWTYNEDRKGVDFSQQELLEWSIVPVPANAEALVEARSAGIDLTPMLAWAEEKLDTWKKEDSLYVPKGQVEAVFRILSAHKIGIALPARVSPPVLEEKVVPPNVSSEMCPMAEAWSAPSLFDFTTTAWGDLSDTEKRSIAGHFAWAASMPPAIYGDLKLPHHRASDGKVVFRGVAAAAGRMNQSSIPEGDMGAVKAHLRRHYAQFDQPAPDSLKDADNVVVSKRGRVLSAANEQKLRNAMQDHMIGMQHHETGMNAMKEVLAQVEVAPETDGLEITEQRSADLVLEITEPAKEELHIEASNNGHKTIDITPETITLAVRESLAGFMTGIAREVQEQTQAAINRARGRAD